jgi:hypothetical protein
MVKKLEATVTLEYADAKSAQAVADAVSPDNLKAPVGLVVKTVRKGYAVVTEIYAEMGFAKFIATIDDLLFSASTAEKALRIVQSVNCFEKNCIRVNLEYLVIRNSRGTSVEKIRKPRPRKKRTDEKAGFHRQEGAS